MFSYQPNQSRAGEYVGQGILSEAQSQIAGENRKYDTMMQGAKVIGDAAKKVVGFMVGGPMGAAMASGGGGGGGEGADSVIGSFVQSYANNKALEAKGSAYGDFMKRHGAQLGFDPEWIKDFTGRDAREQAMIGDSMLNMQNMGQYVARNQYAETYMQPRAPRATPAYGANNNSGGGFVTVP